VNILGTWRVLIDLISAGQNQTLDLMNTSKNPCECMKGRDFFDILYIYKWNNVKCQLDETR
jgi:hypothetical protein